MAQSIMHLLIANGIYKSKVIAINAQEDFLLGSIAPDAVHVREDYARELKDLSHYNFNCNSEINHFDTFLKRYETSENKDFILGYLVHLLSDMEWYHTIRVPFKQKLANDKKQKMSMNEAYYFDCEQLDYLLCFDESVQDIIKKLYFSTAYSLEGLIEANHVEIWKKQILSSYKDKNQTAISPNYISEQQIRNYIEQCTDICLNYLRDKV